jgi:secondary thiamine-phosphate synthase enzyme
MNVIKTIRDNISVSTKKKIGASDISAKIDEIIEKNSFQSGIAVVFCPHTTCGLLINEFEENLIKDFEDVLQKWFPPQQQYHHDSTDPHMNAHAHLQTLQLKTSETVPISNGKLLLGTWQKVMLVELDGPKERKVIIQIIGM